MTAKPKVGRSDRYPSEERQGGEQELVSRRQGQGREGYSRGYGGSSGEGTGPSGPDSKK